MNHAARVRATTVPACALRVEELASLSICAGAIGSVTTVLVRPRRPAQLVGFDLSAQLGAGFFRVNRLVMRVMRDQFRWLRCVGEAARSPCVAAGVQ